MFNTINTHPAPPPAPQKPKLSRGKKLFLFAFGFRGFLALAKLSSWMADHRKVWIIERKHPEFGTKWYYVTLMVGPFVSSAKKATHFRRKKAEKKMNELKSIYYKHEFCVLNIEIVKEND